MKRIKDMNILIVGLGLMGGSYAKALKNKGIRVSAITKDRDSVDYAIKNGIIDKGTTTVDGDMIGEADLVVFALYPNVFKKWIKDNQHFFKPGCVITDVTGVKSSVVYDIQKILRDDVEFIAAHPMAGREVYGVRNSDPAIFEKANYIVTPTDKNSSEAIRLCKELGETLGFSRISALSPEEHDEVIGFVSQLTHCIAITLMTCNEKENLEKYTGDSFRDLTRIARINEDMWSELFMMNKSALLTQMDMFEEKFIDLRKMIRTDNVEGIKEMMRHSTKRRALFDK